MSTSAPLPRHLIPSCFESHLSLTENSPFPRVLLDVIMEYVAPQILVVASGFTLNTFVQGEEGDTSLSNAATPKLSPNYYQPITNAVSTKYFPSPHLLSTHASTNPSDAFITDVVTSAHGHVVTSSYSGRLTVWDMSRQTQWNGVPDKQGTASYPSINASSTAGTPIHSLLALSDGRIIAGASNGKLHIFNYDPVHGLIPAYTSTNIVRDKETVCSMVEVHDSGAFRYLLPEDDDKKSEDMTDAKDTSDTTMTDDPAPINAVYVISACESSVLKLWRILPTRCELLRSISGHAGGVICLANMSDGRICSGSWDKTIKIWDVTSPTIPCVATLTGHTQLISALTVLPHLNTGYDIIISGSMDKSIRIWCTDDQNTYRCTYIQNEAHTTLVRTLKMMPDGSALISSSNDNSVSVWPVSRSTGRLGPALPLIPRVEEGASRRVYLTLAPEPNWHALLRAQ